MAKIIVAMSSEPQISISRSKKGGKKKSNRSIFFKELMKRLAGDAGNAIADAYVTDHSKFKGMMIKIAHDMGKVENEEAE